MIRLRTLGESIIEVDGVPHTPQFDTLFAALVYLTAERGRRVARQTLAELLWPNQDLSRARHCLRQLLYRMRVAGCPVEGGRDTLLLPESLVVPTFSAAPAAERLVAERAAGTLVIGPFLPGYVPPFSDAFSEWIERAREAMDARVRRVLLEVVHAHKLRGEWDQVDVLAAEVLRIDPLNEEATLARAEATAMVGAKTEAVALLDRYMAELGPERAQLQLPAAVLRKRIAERFPVRRHGATSDQVFVGRADIMETLSTALLRARKSEGSGILLTGVAGIGKTRLVQELTKVASMQGVRVVRANTVEFDRDRPLSALVELAPQLRTLKGAIGVSPESLRFLDRLTDAHPLGVAAREDADDPRWIAIRMRQSIVDLCAAVSAENTVLFVIEDVHWLDAASWDVVAALLDGVSSRRLLLLLTSRGPHPTPLTPQRCTEQLAVHRVEPLTRAASASYARSILAENSCSLPSETLEWIVASSDGNPLFLRELVTHSLTKGDHRSIPLSIQALLDARLARLSKAARRVLEAAAVLGSFSTPELLHTTLEIPTHELAGALGEIAHERLIDDNSRLITPRHALLQERVISSTPTPVLRMLHRRAASVLVADATGGATIEALLASALHWQAAHEGQRAVAMLDDAAAGVARLGAIGDSIRLREVAIELSSSDAQRLAISRRLLRSYALNAQWDRVASLAAQLSCSSLWGADRNLAAADSVVGIEAEFRTGGDPATLVQRALAIASDSTLTASTRLSGARRGIIVATNLGAFHEQSRLWAAIADLRSVSTLDRFEWLGVEVIVETNSGDLLSAIERADQLQQLITHEPDPGRRLSALANVAQANLALGLREKAVSLLKQLRHDAREVGSVHFESIALHRLIEHFADEGVADAARSYLSQLDQCLECSGGPFNKISVIEARARLALLDANYDAAVEQAFLLRECVSDDRQPLLWIRRSAATTLAEALLLRDRNALPEDLLEELQSIHRAAHRTILHDRTAAVIFAALHRSGRREDAETLLTEYITEQRRSLAEWDAARTVLRFLVAD